MTKFHINKHGVPAPCRAKPGNCPLGGEGEHFDNLKDAENYIHEKSMEEHSLLPKVDSSKPDEGLQDDFNKVYGLDDPTTAQTFMLDVDSIEYLGYLDDVDNPEQVKQEFINNFGEDSFVVESQGENKVVDMLTIGQNVDPINQRYNEIANELIDEGYNHELLDYNSDKYYEDNKDFNNAYNEFLSERQGPEIEMYGKTLRSVENPHSEDTKEFFKKYIENDSNLQRDFNKVYGTDDPTTAQTFILDVDSIEHLGYLDDVENPEQVKQEFVNKFGEDSFVVESQGKDKVVDMLTIGQNVDPINQRYNEIANELKDEGYNHGLLDYNSDKHYEDNKDFNNAYNKFLSERQGPEVEMYGKTLRSIESPYSEDTKNFFRSYIENN